MKKSPKTKSSKRNTSFVFSGPDKFLTAALAVLWFLTICVLGVTTYGQLRVNSRIAELQQAVGDLHMRDEILCGNMPPSALQQSFCKGLDNK